MPEYWSKQRIPPIPRRPVQVYVYALMGEDFRLPTRHRGCVGHADFFVFSVADVEFYIYPDQLDGVVGRLDAIVKRLRQLSSEAPEEPHEPQS